MGLWVVGSTHGGSAVDGSGIMRLRGVDSDFDTVGDGILEGFLRLEVAIGVEHSSFPLGWAKV